MLFTQMILVFSEYCRSKQLRPETIQSYEQILYLMAAWMKEAKGIVHVDDVKDVMFRRYVIDLQTRGKYTFCADEKQKKINCPENRGDYSSKISNIMINNYLRNINVFFFWLEEMEFSKRIR